MATGLRELMRRREAAVGRLANAAETVRGSLIERYLPCGKAGCRCKSGEQSDLHGPAYYLTLSYPGRRTRQIYVPKRLKPTVERWLQNHGEIAGALEEITTVNLELLRRKVPTSDSDE